MAHQKKVRCSLTLMTFPVNRDTLEPLRCAQYDPYCYSDPEPDTEYIEISDWITHSIQREHYYGTTTRH